VNAAAAEQFGGWRWPRFVAPLVVFLAVTALEPTADMPGGQAIGLAIPYAAYPWVYTAKIALTLAALAWAWPALRSFPTRWTWLAVLVGLVGGGLWIGLGSLGWEARVLSLVGLEKLLAGGARSHFNPLAEMAATPGLAVAFLGVRLAGLAVVIALAEELFLRGFLMRFVTAVEWWALPLRRVDRTAIIVGTVFPMLMHPGELLAAAAWFSLVTWLMLRTGSFWDCVIAHGVTNLTLGVYAIVSGRWELL